MGAGNHPVPSPTAHPDSREHRPIQMASRLHTGEKSASPAVALPMIKLTRPFLLPARLLWPLLPLLNASLALAQSPVIETPIDIDEAFRQQGRTPPELLDPVRLSPVASSHYFLHDLPAQRVAFVFLPPRIPVLYAPLHLRSPLDTGVPPPAELDGHVADIFYPQLAARLAADDLPRRLRLKLESYRTTKAALQAELRELIAYTRDQTPADRLAAFAASAREQAPRLEELEVSEERLRAELGAPVPTGPRGRGAGAMPPTALPPPADAPFMRAAAFFLDGLSPAQRRLLRAVADESESRPDPTVPTVTFFFAPEGASLRLPAELAPSTRALIESFTTDRRTLALTLIDTIRAPRCDSNRLAELAAAQAPALAALESQAEEIRLALRPLPEPPGMAPLVIPPALAERLASYRERKKALFRELYTSIRITASAGATTGADQARPAAIPVSAFTPEQQAKLTALNTEMSALRAALGEHRRNSGATADRKSIDTLIEDFERARQLQELRDLYRDYRTALLEPGLSSAQRRLLFGAGLQALDLPLPFGEVLLQP